MAWSIPPLGWCAVCLAARDEQQPAHTTFKGTALCQHHLLQVVEEDGYAGVGEGEEPDDDEKEGD